MASTSVKARSMRPFLAKSASTFTPNAICRRQPSPGPFTCSSLTPYSAKKHAAKSTENSSPNSFRRENSMRCSQVARSRPARQ
jgi:hypothetical protein